MLRLARPCAGLLLGVAVAVLAWSGAVGTGSARVQSQRKPPVEVTERVTATVLPGLLLVSVPMPKPFRDDGRVHDTEPLQVVVRDSRPGTPGWSLGGVVHGFTDEGEPRPSATIRWAPRLVSASRGAVVTVAPAGVGAPIEQDPGAAARHLASGAPGKSFGTTVVAVDLGVPLGSRQDLFTGDVTFTVL